MEIIKGVTTEPFEPFSSNEKGSTYEQSERPNKTFLMGIRKEGAVFGNHYHLGKNAAKNPEILWLLSGQWKLEVRPVNESRFKEAIISAPSRIEIHPHIVHRVTALTDSLFLEFNSLEEHIKDTAYPEDD